MNNLLIAPSTEPSPIDQLPEYLVELEKAGADWLHCDVMDGEFVPNTTFDEMVLNIISKRTKLPKDVHLMIAEPLQRISSFARAGADIITVHYEALANAQAITTAITKIHKLNKKAGLSIKPNTSVELLIPYLDKLDLVLVMSVEPGMSGQSFLPNSLDKIKWLKEYKYKNNLQFLIEVDGGVNIHNIQSIKEAGANVVVSGSAIFKALDRTEYISSLRNS